MFEYVKYFVVRIDACRDALVGDFIQGIRAAIDISSQCLQDIRVAIDHR